MELEAKERERKAERQRRIEAERFETGHKVRLRWSDHTQRKIESVRVAILDRNAPPVRPPLTRMAELEEATPEEVIALIRQLRERNHWEAKLLARGLDAKRPRWWLEYERKEIATPYLAVTLNVERTGAESARLRKGEFEGKPITSLTTNEFQRLLRVLDREDQKGARYARQVFDTMRQQWRTGQGTNSGRTGHARGKMSIAEARECLGVSENASLKEITERGRALRQRNHPDKGGSAKIFRDVNEALEVLTDHHGNDR